jgi:hypothetical protein
MPLMGAIINILRLVKLEPSTLAATDDVLTVMLPLDRAVLMMSSVLS